MGYIINRSIVWTRPEKHGICSHKRRLPSSCNRNPIPDDGITTAHVPSFDQGTYGFSGVCHNLWPFNGKMMNPVDLRGS